MAQWDFEQWSVISQVGLLWLLQERLSGNGCEVLLAWDLRRIQMYESRTMLARQYINHHHFRNARSTALVNPGLTIEEGRGSRTHMRHNACDNLKRGSQSEILSWHEKSSGHYDRFRGALSLPHIYEPYYVPV